jgi:high-affinity iron transporter
MSASILATFLVVFREALEAGLIIGVILTVLARLKATQYYRYIFISIGLAVIASLGIAGLLESLTENAQGQWEKIIEGVVSLVACGVLTYMVFWMAKQTHPSKSEVEDQLNRAVSAKDLFVMVSLPFVAVFREGAETVLYLKAISLQSSQAVSWWGGLSGLALALMVTLLIFVGGRRVSLRPLFMGTSIFLVLVAAGLLAYGIHELEEAGWLNGIIYPIWNINHILNEKEGIGSFLKALFGYNGNPSLLEVSFYVTYLVVMMSKVQRQFKGK